MFPWLRPFVVNQQRIMNNVRETFKECEEILSGLKKTLNPRLPRGIADSFMIRQQKDEVLSVLLNQIDLQLPFLTFIVMTSAGIWKNRLFVQFKKFTMYNQQPV